MVSSFVTDNMLQPPTSPRPGPRPSARPFPSRRRAGWAGNRRGGAAGVTGAGDDLHRPPPPAPDRRVRAPQVPEPPLLQIQEQQPLE